MSNLAERWRARIDDVNARGPEALDEFVSIYAENMVFIDSIQELHGRSAYRDMNARLLGRVRSLRVELDTVIASGDDVLMATGRMVVVSKLGPAVTVHGAMHMRAGADGLIAYQRDYMDLASSLFDGVPVVGGLYRKLVVATLG